MNVTLKLTNKVTLGTNTHRIPIPRNTGWPVGETVRVLARQYHVPTAAKQSTFHDISNL